MASRVGEYKLPVEITSKRLAPTSLIRSRSLQGEGEQMTQREIERLLDLLLKLSEENTDGRLRDEIAHIRDYLWGL